MSIMALIAGHSHFKREKNSFKLFTVDTCEDCGKLCFDPGVTLHAPKSGSAQAWAYDTELWLKSGPLKELPENASLEGLYCREGDGLSCCLKCCDEVPA